MIADAKASGTRPRSTAVNSNALAGVKPSVNGRTYPSTNGIVPSAVPHTIHRSCRRAVTEHPRFRARIMMARPPTRLAARYPSSTRSTSPEMLDSTAPWETPRITAATSAPPSSAAGT